MQHLGPIKSRGAESISGDQNQISQSHLHGDDNSKLSKTFEALEAERSRIRGQLSPNQAQLDASQANVARYTRISSDELNAAQVAEVDKANYNLESDEASFEADHLNKEAIILEDQAAKEEGPKANLLKDQAETKREEAKEEEEKARLASMNAEIASDEAASRLQLYRVAEQNVSSNSADVTNYSNQVRALQSQDSALGTRLSGARSSSGTGSSGTSTASGTSSSSASPSSGTSLRGASSSSTTSSPALRGASTSSVDKLSGSQVYSPYGTDTRIDWSGGGYGFTAVGSSPALAYYFAAVGLLGVIGKVSRDMMFNASPVVQISKNLTIKGMSEQAIAYLEAALVDSTIQGTPVNQQIILKKAQASALHGEAETNIAFWKEAINENKQLLKQTQDLAKSA